MLLVLGFAIGLLAGIIARGSGFGIAMDAISGAVGAVGLGFVLPSLGMDAVTRQIGTLAAGIVGAILLVLARQVLRYLAFR